MTLLPSHDDGTSWTTASPIAADAYKTAARAILDATPGEDASRDGLRDTPQRFAKAMLDLTVGYTMNVEDQVGGAIFQVAHQEMVIQTDIPIYSLCEHHMLPFFGQVDIAYIPNPAVGVLGLSKLCRIIPVFSRRFQVQERLTEQIADALYQVAKARGVAVIMTCRHMCMEMRGICQPGVTTTTLQKRGVFVDDPVKFQEFCALASKSLTPRTTPVSCSSCTCCATEGNTSRSSVVGTSETERSSSLSNVSQDDLPAENIDDYSLYLRCATDEPSACAKLVKAASMGPLTSSRPQGISILDIGAGNGSILQSLSDVADESFSVGQYTAFEKDPIQFAQLQSRAKDRAKVLPEEFGLETKVATIGGPFDVVLLSHCLYGHMDKVALVDHALQFVRPGGILLLIHRWEKGGTLDEIGSHLVQNKILFHQSLFESCLNLAGLTGSQRRRLHSYTQGVVTLNEGQLAANRTMGCISIEPFSCSLGDPEKVLSFMEKAKRNVGFMARKKHPVAVVSPSTVTGVQACLRAAALRWVGNGHVSVVGGGHSENAWAQNAIAIDMRLWNQVFVDPVKKTVKLGGGSKSGEVLAACQKHGLFVPLGDRPGVGVGLILQGGLNHFMRNFGLATDNIVALCFVDPSGNIRQATSDTELFPFRGAGSNFGVVLEITMRCHTLTSIRAKDVIYRLSKPSYERVLVAYSSKAQVLEKTMSSDGFLYWSNRDEMSFATSMFDIGETRAEEAAYDPLEIDASIEEGHVSTFTPLQLYDRELYMTKEFSAFKFSSENQPVPMKPRSNKRCILLPPIDATLEEIFTAMLKSCPSKWCYVHLLHGGGRVSGVEPGASAFGCRDWHFAAVLTARWASGDDNAELSASKWLDEFTRRLLPMCSGVYAADLGPRDRLLARKAFGLNLYPLAQLKRQADPLNIIGEACPIDGKGQDPRVQPRGVVVIFCGRRCAGKDWLANIACEALQELIGKKGIPLVEVASISDETKRDFAASFPSIDIEKLLSSRRYKEEHRRALADFYQKRRAEDIAYDAKCFARVTTDSGCGHILLLTGMRDGLDYARRLAGKPVILVHVQAPEFARKARGWTYDASIDESEGETVADNRCATFWDLAYDNGVASDTLSARRWTEDQLVPCILKACTRSIADMRLPGIEYRDIFGSLLLQSFALPLWRESVLRFLIKKGFLANVDCVVAPESTGYIFAAPVAEALAKPLVVVRKGTEKLVGPVDKVWFEGSNISRLQGSQVSDHFSIAAGSIVPGQRVLVVDDCLASGSTLGAIEELLFGVGGTVVAAAFLMELPDLRRRSRQGIDVFSVMQFPGK